ncbi:MAG: hypothetical protein AAF728_08920 [Cyanobacteria bacterium P01_D01_bin.128]
MLLKHSVAKVSLASCAIAGLSALGASTAQATTVLTGFQTSGADMVGMEITVNFLSGLSETATWQFLGGSSGGASSSSWSLVQSGNTFNDFNNPWQFRYSGTDLISSLVIDAVPGNTVFDTVSAAVVTPGSADGGSFEFLGGVSPTAVDYSVPIDISQGDLFGKLTLTWDGGFGPGGLDFLSDTDSGTISNPVTPVDPDPVDPDPIDPDPVDPDPIDPDPVDPDPVSIPEPGMVLGLIGLGAWGLKRTLVRRRLAS